VSRPTPDDSACLPAAASTLVRAGGCLGTNSGFDGQSYQNLWPNGDLTLRPSPILFTSPLTGAHYTTNYSQAGFEADLPRIEDPSISPGNNCDRSMGAGCTRIPLTDDHTVASFYPFFSSGTALGGCAWTIGQNVPGFSTNDYGGNNQYGRCSTCTTSAPAPPSSPTSTTFGGSLTTPASPDRSPVRRGGRRANRPPQASSPGRSRQD
jgi:hypothetical protein